MISNTKCVLAAQPAQPHITYKPSIFDGMTIEYKHGVFVPPLTLFCGLDIFRRDNVIPYDHAFLTDYKVSHCVAILDNLLAELFEYSTKLPDNIYLRYTEMWSEIRIVLKQHLDTLRKDRNDEVLHCSHDNEVRTSSHPVLADCFTMIRDGEYMIAIDKCHLNSLAMFLFFENAVANDNTLFSLLDVTMKIPCITIHSPWLQPMTSIDIYNDYKLLNHDEDEITFLDLISIRLDNWCCWFLLYCWWCILRM